MQNLLYITAICILFAGSVLADETVDSQSITSMQHEMDAQRKAMEQAAKQGGYELKPKETSAQSPDTAFQQPRRARQRDLVGVAIDNKSDGTRATHIVDVYGEQKRELEQR